jgi:membrane protease YdiL (CAAX protease family)
MWNPELDLASWLARAGSDGFIVAVGALATTLTCVPFIWFLVARYEPAPWSYLGLRPCPWKSVVLSCIAMAVFIAGSDSLTVALGKPVVPPFVASAYASARSPVLLFAALVCAAPLLEELFFRGFVISSLRSLGASLPLSALVPAIAWSGVHAQYDLYSIGTLFVAGLLLAGARLWFQSIVPCIAMHCLSNAVAFVEAVVFTPGMP